MDYDTSDDDFSYSDMDASTMAAIVDDALSDVKDWTENKKTVKTKPIFDGTVIGAAVLEKTMADRDALKKQVDLLTKTLHDVRIEIKKRAISMDLLQEHIENVIHDGLVINHTGGARGVEFVHYLDEVNEANDVLITSHEKMGDIILKIDHVLGPSERLNDGSLSMFILDN